MDIGNWNFSNERFLFTDPYFEDYCCWIKKDYSGIKIFYYEDEMTEYYPWDKIEELLADLEKDKEQIPLAQRVREKIAPYYQKLKAQNSSNREEI
jgi:hypothetical protein